MKRLGGIIDSMTPAERRNPSKLIDQSRRRRIAAGAGVEPHEVNELVKQFDGMAGMMKEMAGLGMRDRIEEDAGVATGAAPTRTASCKGPRSAPANGSRRRNGPSSASSAKKRPAAASAEARREAVTRTAVVCQASRPMTTIVEHYASRLQPTDPGGPRGSTNSHEEDGPKTSAVLPHLCHRLAQPARRPRAGRTGHLRPDGPRDRRPGLAQGRAHRLLAGRRRPAVGQGQGR